MFHSHPPLPDYVLGNQPELSAGYTMESVESSYMLANQTNIKSASCPSGRLCLIKAHYSSGSWEIHEHYFRYIDNTYPVRLSNIVDSLMQNKIYHLIIKGPATGKVLFTSIHYTSDYTFYKYNADSRTYKTRITTTVSYPIILKNGSPDGMLTFAKANISQQA
ncbi:hypothetical protein DSO57_1035509 [Entomophthora muscae]|uniref:Uncharacterized protein n=1 Tax=Entomophthora muscae TaxID=34485 RepID=A0ACC2SCX1_9FUNG|nr:hypothetical protein DSO57_1035509 [Entomophthora muscae]